MKIEIITLEITLKTLEIANIARNWPSSHHGGVGLLCFVCTLRYATPQDLVHYLPAFG